MFFDGWHGVLRVIVVGICAYAYLVLLLRLSGKRTLAKLNAFDFLVTVALGSTLSSVLVSSGVALVEGIVALTLLAALQYAVAWVSVRNERFRRLVRSEPRLLYREGFLRAAMRRERVTEGDLRQAARRQGHAGLERVDAIVLETDGSFSVLGSVPPGAGMTVHGGEAG